MRGMLSVTPVLLALVPSVAVPQTVIPALLSPSGLRAGTDPVRDQVPNHDTTVIEQAEDGLFYVQASVNGAPVQFVVDTGSSVVILNGPDAARAGVGSETDVAVETASGSAPMKRARIKRVVFAGQILHGVDAAVVRNDLKVSLLGQSVLSQLGSVTFKGSRLELR